MRTIKSAGILWLLLCLLSCKEEEPSFTSIVGRWKGTLAEVQVKPFGLPLPFSEEDDSFATEIEFKADGTMIVYGESQDTEGTYQVVGEKLTTDINFSTEIVELPGTGTIETLTQTTLVFYIKKDNTTITDPDSGRSISGDIKATLHFERL